MLHQKTDIFCKIELGLPLSKVQDLLAEIDANYGEIVKYKIDSDGQRHCCPVKVPDDYYKV